MRHLMRLLALRPSRSLIGLIVFAALSGCAVTIERTPPQQASRPSPNIAIEAERAVNRFRNVIAQMEPFAEQVCREERRSNCDFRVLVDGTPNQPPNAFQTLDRNGRPILVFNLALIGSVQNADELAFVVGHEAAHHIARHLDRQRRNAAAGAAVFGEAAAAVFGRNAEAIRAGQELGAALASRTFSKDFELEADALGTVITHRAGFDPIRGAQFFNALPDPQNRFLGTHPPNKDRIETVRRVAATLGR